MAAANQTEIEAEGSVNYDTNTNITTADKKVTITNQQGIIQADHVIFDANQGLINANGYVKVNYKGGTVIEASELRYDNNNDFAEFSGEVHVITTESRIHAQKLTYDGVSGDIHAIGDVKIIQSQSTFQSDTLDYNLKTEEGQTGVIQGVVKQKNKNLTINGNNSTIDNRGTQLSKVTLTTCPKPNPDFTISATKMKYDDKWVKLWNPVLFIKGIPVFYFPYLAFPADGTGFPRFDLGYSEADGYKVSANYGSPVEHGRNWSVNSAIYTNSTSNIGMGVGAFYGNISNYSNAYYYFYKDDNSNYFNINDHFYINYPLFLLAVDGSYDFNSSEKQQYGVSLTRKYWSSPVGNLQFGVLARNVFAYDDSHHEYGGTYGGYRLDYNPNRYMTFSLLRLYPIHDNDYGDFFDDYRLGSNWIYNMSFPLNQVYSLHFEGSYNSDEDYWAHQIYSVTRETCCFKFNIGWDNIPKSIVWSGSLKF